MNAQPFVYGGTSKTGLTAFLMSNFLLGEWTLETPTCVFVFMAEQ